MVLPFEIYQFVLKEGERIMLMYSKMPFIVDEKQGVFLFNQIWLKKKSKECVTFLEQNSYLDKITYVEYWWRHQLSCIK